jgi:hypothetical protein
MTNQDITQLSQQGIFAPPIQFTLLRGRELEIARRVGRSRQVYKIDLLALRNPSEKIVTIAWKWWLASLGTFLGTVLLVLLLNSLQLGGYAWLVGGIGTISSLVLVFVSWKKGTREQVFYSRHSSIPLVTLRLGSPSKNEFRNFVDLIEAQIKAVNDKFKLTRDQELAGEMRTLRRLSEDGVISMEEYQNSKEVLFQKH